MRVLVTGGAGFLGSHLAEALVERGDDVVILDNFQRGRLENLSSLQEKVAVVNGDVRDPAVLNEAMSGIEMTFHLAAQSNVIGSLTDLDYSFSTNVTGTVRVLNACVDHGVRRVIFASSREVYGDSASLPVVEDSPLVPKNPYGASKMAAEAYCNAWQATFGLECQILRFANLYGPRDHGRVIPLWLEAAVKGHDLQLFGGEQVLDFTWVGTGAEALIAAAELSMPVGPINVGSGRGVLLRELADRILGLGSTTSALTILPARSAEVFRFIADTTRMRNVLGIVPEDDSLLHLSKVAVPECGSAEKQLIERPG